MLGPKSHPTDLGPDCPLTPEAHMLGPESWGRILTLRIWDLIAHLPPEAHMLGPESWGPNLTLDLIAHLPPGAQMFGLKS